MDLGSIIGVVGGFFFLIISIFITANWNVPTVIAFVSPASALIVFGGIFASTVFAVKFDKFLEAMKSVGIVFRPPVLDPAASIDKIVALANTARKEGVLALEESTEVMDDPFLKKGIMLVVDGTDPELVKGIMETELAYIDERHLDTAATFEYMGSQGPAWGMIGTIIGLILMLMELSDPSSLGPKMSVAFVTTFYGSVLANLIFIPIANKMKLVSSEEILLKTVLIEGMLSIQAGENPRIIEEKLKSFLAPVLRDKVGMAKAREVDE